jgi:mannan endo-1,4-beta-mannosidase
VKDAKVKCTELIDKSIAVAKGVKGVDPGADVVGPAFWGFLDYYSLQEAPDWTDYRNTYGTFINMYLDKMHAASQTEGKRLLDVVDVHWYPQVDETPEKIIQAPRSLWDPAYKEDSWIANDVLNGPIHLLPTLKSSIDTYYPGTKLGITEFRFGDADNGDHYYSGIAVADALGIFGKYGVYMAHYHPTDLDAPIEGYVAAAYKIFRNYDGNRGAFGANSVRAESTDPAMSSIYASADPTALHLIVINKSATEPIAGHFAISGGVTYGDPHVYAFDAGSSTITERPGFAQADDNSFSYTIPPLTVAHVVLRATASSVSREADASATLAEAGPNPFSSESALRFTLAHPAHATLKLYDVLGRELATLAGGDFQAGEHFARIDGSALPTGTYYCRLEAGDVVREVAMRVMR